MQFHSKLATGVSVALIATLSACSTSGVKTGDAEIQARIDDLSRREATINSRENNIASREATLSSREQQISSQASQMAKHSAMPAAAAGTELLPPNAKAGECYARAWVEPKYDTVTERVLKSEASERLEIIPARYETVEERILVQEASERIEVIPAAYKTIKEQVVVKPASTKIVQIPAKYETVTERVLDKPAHTVWKKGQGPIQKIDEATGEIMCLVDVPATYKTITKRILKSGPTTSEVEVPAVYNTVEKQVIDRPATTRSIQIPAKYKTIKVTKLAQPEQTRTIPIPAEYATVTKKVLISDGHMEWRSILCETNMTRNKISEIQRALMKKGFNPGPIDGVIGSSTIRAVNQFQRANKLPVDKYLNTKTIKALGVNPT